MEPLLLSPEAEEMAMRHNSEEKLFSAFRESVDRWARCRGKRGEDTFAEKQAPIRMAWEDLWKTTQLHTIEAPSSTFHEETPEYYYEEKPHVRKARATPRKTHAKTFGAHRRQVKTTTISEQYKAFEAQCALFFASSPARELILDDIPWPKGEVDSLGTFLFHGAQDVRKRYKILCMRWHPDRFMRKFGHFIGNERKQVEERVLSVAQAAISHFDLIQ